MKKDGTTPLVVILVLVCLFVFGGGNRGTVGPTPEPPPVSGNPVRDSSRDYAMLSAAAYSEVAEACRRDGLSQEAAGRMLIEKLKAAKSEGFTPVETFLENVFRGREWNPNAAANVFDELAKLFEEEATR